MSKILEIRTDIYDRGEQIENIIEYTPTNREQQLIDIIASYRSNYALTNIIMNSFMEKELVEAGYIININYTFEDVEHYIRGYNE